MRNIFILLLAAVVLMGCSSDDTLTEDYRINFIVAHPSEIITRATSTRFEVGDKIGVYATEEGHLLEPSGNYLNNNPLSYDGTQWNSKRYLTWNEGHYDFYAYYPYQETIGSVDDMPFCVAADQSRIGTSTEYGGYESSDFMYARTNNVAASTDAVQLQFRHIMARLVTRLIKGEDYEGLLPENAEVYVHNTVTQATIDLKTGNVTKTIKGTTETIKTRYEGNNIYSAIIVPQRIVNRRPLVEVVVNGVSYLYEGTFVFRSGTQHLVNLVIDRNPEQALIQIGGEKVNW